MDGRRWPHFNPSGFLIYLVIGAVLAWVYAQTGRLLAPIAERIEALVERIEH